MEQERRSYPLDLRAKKDEKGRRLEGHAAVFDTLSEDLGGFREIISPGAFEAALERSDVRALWNHDPNYVLGRVKSGTLDVAEDERGLAVTIYPPETSYADDLYAVMERGDVDQMSFAFTVAREKWLKDDDGNAIRQIDEVAELWDVSPVTYPAYQATTVSARALDAAREVRETADVPDQPAEAEHDGDDSEQAKRERELQLMELESEVN